MARYQCDECDEIFDEDDKKTPWFKDAKECPECKAHYKNLHIIKEK